MPTILRSQAEVMSAVVGNTTGFTHILLEDAELPIQRALVDALAEASPRAVVSPLTPLAALSENGDFLRGLLDGTRPTEHTSLRAHRITSAMQAGLSGDSLLLRYQPIVDTHSRRLVMVEALARWRSDPVALTPVNFVPAMEEMGLSRMLGAAVTRLAARDLSRLPGRLPIAVSVNLSVPEMEKRDIAAWLGTQIRASRLPRRRMFVELTETAPVKDRAHLARSMRRLNAAGHGVMLDDFLLDDPRQNLLHLPFAGIKLDRSLVQSLPHSARAREQVRRLARRGLQLTAEGVSSPMLFRLLKNLGVTRAQGFLVGRPLPIEALQAWNNRWRKVPLNSLKE
ncbi:EAL domain-containing protein [Roseococcus pinisoli]|uniref:EAL domain-containing protein n=1 Tax=Roseococcus pinisoli TaxID=2835040 RepID=A0ABS5QDM6_9PROT|nr:EAL domain-containing protein [Roseococcus pinisoli]MBS7811478.1 EAL domain-containing protein [Roseococcus pinisoli]